MAAENFGNHLPVLFSFGRTDTKLIECPGKKSHAERKSMGCVVRFRIE